MKRRTVILGSAALVVTKANANALAYFVTPLADAILVTLRTTIGFFIKEILPAWMKNSALRSLAASVVTALGLAEALNRIEHWGSQGSQTVAIGQSVTTDVAIANEGSNDVVSSYTMVALRDRNTGRDDFLENFPGHMRVAASSGLALKITAHALPAAGYKEILLISDGRVIGRSPSIRVTA